jgi:poly-gamma-glutamate capsule biosynthesis protein CapA/YwtB (metallophosphatase superfamily)
MGFLFFCGERWRPVPGSFIQSKMSYRSVNLSYRLAKNRRQISLPSLTSTTLLRPGALIWILALAAILFQSAWSSSADSTAVTLRFAGDVLLGGRYEQAVGSDVDRAFRDFSLFKTADLSIVNLENPVTTRGEKVPKPFNFRMHPRYLKALTNAGIFTVSLANNHVFDYGRVGLNDTFQWLDSARITYIGAGRNSKDAHRPALLNRAGHKVAVFSYYGGGEAPAAGQKSAGVARRDLSLIKRDIRLARDDGATYIVVILHWGTELADTPSVTQQLCARSLVNAGVDAVIGHHPHVLQGVERYRSGVIVYSLGNCVFGGNSRSTYDTGIFEITLCGVTRDYRFIPVGLRNWHLETLGGRDSLRVIEKVRRLSKVFPNTIP